MTSMIIPAPRLNYQYKEISGPVRDTLSYKCKWTTDKTFLPLDTQAGYHTRASTFFLWHTSGILSGTVHDTEYLSRYTMNRTIFRTPPQGCVKVNTLQDVPKT
jgi:hypothetical protein